MGGVDDDPMGLPHPARPPAGRPPANNRWVLGTLLLLIGIAAVVGVVVAAVSGQPTVALVIALVAAAFFSRVGC
jgi:Flp pilus assembly protein TadB